MIKYHPESRQDVEIGLQTEGEYIVADLIDFGVDSFDITTSKEVDIDATADQRIPGGLGLHLIKQMTDDLGYKFEDGNSTVIIKIAIRGEDV
jgi:anti-sigma regulatory factor (Ser/Thr protein kinase)